MISNTFKKIKNMIYSDYLRIPSDKRKEFIDSQHIKNYTITLMLSKVLALCSIALILMDIDYLYLGSTDASSKVYFGWQLLLIAHSSILISMGLLFTINRVQNLKDTSMVKFWHKFYFNFFCVFTIFSGVNVTLADQYIVPNTTVFSYAIISVSVVCFYKPKDISLIILGSFMYLIIGMNFIQSNYEVMLGMYINGAIVVVLGYFMSLVTNNLKVIEFIKNCKLGESRSKLLEINTQLESTTANLRESNNRLTQANSELKEITIGLKRANESLYRYSYIDGLTGIANRRNFDDTLLNEYKRAVREKTHLSLIILDIDYFKAYNDTYGHTQGDVCLQTIAKLLSDKLIRPGDFIARYGGEEFAVILPNTFEHGALIVAEKLRACVEGHNIEHKGSVMAGHITISVGVACSYPNDEKEPNKLINEADKSMYQAKESGRNRVGIIGKSILQYG